MGDRRIVEAEGPTDEAPRGGLRTLPARLHIHRRSLQIALGLIWIFDGLLKFQPNLLRPSFVGAIIRPMAASQPGLLASAINRVASLLSHGTTTWVALFGLVEIGIGVGLLFRRSVKTALVSSFIWGLGVYVLAEGMGMVLTGDTSPLAGAPGAVCFYVLLGVMVWPTAQDRTAVAPTGAASSVAGRGILGGSGALLVWAAIWIVEAVVWLLPFNRTGHAVANELTLTAQGEPGWYAHVLGALARISNGGGVEVAIVLAALSLIIAIGPLVGRHPQRYIALGIGLALLYWATGEGLGEILTFSGTDPSNGPLVALIGLSVWPLVPQSATAPAPASRLAAVHPVTAALGALAVVLVPLGVGVLPAAADTTAALSPSPLTSASASSASGMSMAMPGLSKSPKAQHGTAGKRAPAMNMSAMAGLDVTDPHWKYTGPPLPAAEVTELTVTSAKTDAGHKMQTPNCDTTPTADQVLGATQYVQATSAAVAKYKDLSTALAAGYVPITNPNYPVVHYLNYRYMNRQDIMNPTTVDSLVYATTPYGPVLVAAMYLMPGSGNGPMPYGCLVQWHEHTNLCRSDRTGRIAGFTPCAPGTTFEGDTPMMTHVWQVPVAGGPLAIDPSDLQVVEAAIMAQQEGLAPTTSGTTPS
ncbi:MAG TPA: hypothetical protein VGG38_11880 [Acidimicrobiales bacterium]|jgi:hypothetical protein